MANYANQKYFDYINIDIIKNDNPINKGESFLYGTTWKYIHTASKLLSGTGFKVWFYCLQLQGVLKDKDNPKKYVDFSPQAIENMYGVSVRSAQRAFEELEKLGFLIKEESKKNFYHFSPIPTKAVPE